MHIIQTLSEELQIEKKRIEAAVRLMDEGCTVPFIARYRKEATGAMDDASLRRLEERLRYLRALQEKKEQVLRTIAEAGKLTDELKRQIEAAGTAAAVEDLYLPYRPKRRTRAGIAREKGLEGLADLIAAQESGMPVEKLAEAFVQEERGVASIAEAIQGALDILAERISENAACRAQIRAVTMRKGRVVCTAKDPSAHSVYEMYYNYEEPVGRIPGHRVLALNRGEREKYLTVRIAAPEEEILHYLERQVVGKKAHETAAYLTKALADAYARLIAPAIEREIRNGLTESAQEGAIDLFGKNLRQLLMQPPIAGKTVLGWDPAFRTGCKLAVVDPTGRVLATKVIFPTAPQHRVDEAKEELKKLVDAYKVDLISLGNGTASRESEQLIAALLPELNRPVQYVVVSEAGASVYSASSLGAEEFPQFDPGQRSAVSIARRLQDPLAELVKIDPKAIGVGQYQHDVDQKKLGEKLSHVVEDCVNRVGVDLNTASAALLGYVSGISKTVAANIVAFREENGRFTRRSQLHGIPKLGPKAYEQCAGFLRIRDGEEALDATAVHPESYVAARLVMKRLGVTEAGRSSSFRARIPDMAEFATELGIGVPTLEDILDELEKPSRDPRETMPAPVLKSNALDMADLKPGMRLQGVVRNIADFGAFVDIGVHQDGLLHISQISDHYIRHPMDALSIGDVVDVEILTVDAEKKRIGLKNRGVIRKQ